MNKIGTITNPDDVFDDLTLEQLRAIKSSIFAGFFTQDPSTVESSIPNVLRAIKTEGERVGLSQEQGKRLVNITNMMKDSETNKGHIQSFRDKMNTLVIDERTVPQGLISETPSANVVDDNKRRLYLALQAEHRQKQAALARGDNDLKK